MIEVLASGPLTTVQDGGRPGYAAQGVPRSGAFDRAAYRLANRLVGNDQAAAVLEITAGGLAVRFGAATTVALTGAQCSGLDWGLPMTLAAGTVIRLGRPARGLRSYLAVRGGIGGRVVLGSRSTDLLSGLGPAPLRAGDSLSIAGADTVAITDTAGVAPRAAAAMRVVLGPRADWFESHASQTLVETNWIVRPSSDRIGIRLDGPALPRLRHEELPSEPTLPGAVQITADGRPILFGPDAPVTGGYPVLAVVPRGDLDLAAQLRPGDEVRFRRTDEARAT